MVGSRVVITGLVLSLFAVATVAQFQPQGPPETTSYFVREDLATATDLTGFKRILRFVQISDAHILDDDAPYPIRQEPLDRIGVPFDAAQRPQEEFTDEVLDSMLQAINLRHETDAFQFLISTGDNTDNALENELMRLLDIFAGTHTTKGPISGLTCQPDGQSTSVSDTSNDVVNSCTSLPAHLVGNLSGLAPSLAWYAAFGNHDALVQGNAPVEPSFNDAAARYGRRFLKQPEYVAMHFAENRSCTAIPAGTPSDDFGHGFGYAGSRLCDNDPDNDGYYAYSVNGVHFIVIDTVNDDFVNGNEHLRGNFNPQTTVGSDVIGGYADGAIDPAQMNWIRSEIKANPDKLIVLFSHHTVNSMFSNKTETYCAPGLGCLADLLQQAGYLTGPQLAAEFASYPNVVAWMGGHTHRHSIEAKKGTNGGFWNIETSSLIDYPQEARTVELWASPDGTKAFWKLDDFSHSYQASKDLEATDAQRDITTAGKAKDQNVLLWMNIPAGVKLTPQPAAARQLLITLPGNQNASVGNDVTVSVQVADAATKNALSGLEVTWTVTHSPRICGGKNSEVTTDVLPTRLTDAGNGSYRGNFTPTDAVTHYILVTVQDSLTQTSTGQVLSLPVEGTRPACPAGDKGIPSAGVVVALAATALAFAMRRRD